MLRLFPNINFGVMGPLLAHYCMLALGLWIGVQLPESAIYGMVYAPLHSDNVLIDGLLRWDAHLYVRIAVEGYEAKSVAFFPVLPMLMRALVAVGFDVKAAGLLVTNVSYMAVFWLLDAWLAGQEWRKPQRQTILWAFAVVPTSFFFNSIYSEAIFLALALGVAVACQKGRFWLLGLLLILASLTRNIGFFLALIPLSHFLQEYLDGRKVANWRWRNAYLCLLAPFVALALLAVFQYVSFGSPFAFVEAQGKYWDRTFSLPWQGYIANLRFIKYRWPLVAPGIVLDSLMVTVAALAWLALAVQLWRKRDSATKWMNMAYLVLAAIWLIVPLLSTVPYAPIISNARYCLVQFPLLPVAVLLPRFWRLVLGIISAGLMVWAVAGFSSWQWVG